MKILSNDNLIIYDNLIWSSFTDVINSVILYITILFHNLLLNIINFDLIKMYLSLNI